MLKLRNPLNEDTAVMRTQLTHSMLTTIALNKSRGNEDFKLFELGRVYLPNGKGELPNEKYALAIGAVAVDFFAMKNLVNAVMAYFKADYSIKYSVQPYLHPGISADVYVNGKVIGSFGEVHPTIADNYGISCKAYVAELDLDTLLDLPTSEVKYSAISKFPCVNRDLAVIVKDEVPVGELIATVKEACGEALEDVKLFDVYKGEQIEKGYKSVAFSLRFRSVERTLADADIQKMMLSAMNEMKTKHGAELR
ncbi:MAG: phenylalanine--tRNA ligase subunit beta, partial [Clostridia bacterium]|nr:phenylalanine--tRNA ligase subunit beta [Clostridia bacterium]